MKKKMKLGAFLPAPGHHVAAWRHPNAKADGGEDFEYYLKITKEAERGKMDMIFLSDGNGVRTTYKNEEELSRQGRMVHFEPLTLMSALAVNTKNIGLAATASTTYNEPFHIARKFSSLDHLSKGRAAWNVVTSVTDAEAQNFNLDSQPAHADRYARANEFMTVVNGLWNSWEDDAFIYDKITGKYFNPQKLHILNHKGKHFSVKGPLNISRSPQGKPVIIQAGSSEAGKEFAAKNAEVIFTAQVDIDKAKGFYKDIKEKAMEYGRDPDQLLIMPGLFLVIGKTKQEALQKYEDLQELIDTQVALGLLEGLLGDVDLSDLKLSDTLPPLPKTEGSKSRQSLIYDEAYNKKLTLKELLLKVSGGRGHKMIIGSPKDIADEMEKWVLNQACDGFNIMPSYLPDGLEDFVNLVIPELQERELFKKEYIGNTLRENLGFDRPDYII
ncbi:LLM class flavin-dependent oxidoreductase [Lysinibacillus xylanilyticus]|uniref:LLM class flavin-dependent oxidoreductase n=1 Tax=Lysinibacillus xylanilyticus TaxID=582475 RepID=UPI003D03A51A